MKLSPCTTSLVKLNYFNKIKALLGTNPPDFKTYFFDLNEQNSDFYKSVENQTGIKYIGKML
jgi:hypothetical protein